MLHMFQRSAVVIMLVLMACSDQVDPLAPGSITGEFAVGNKGLLPIAVGNRWTFTATTFDTSGVEIGRHAYTMFVVDTVIADTALIPVAGGNRQGLTATALRWYAFRGDGGAITLWQVDTLEQLRFRSDDDRRFFDQTSFNFRAALYDTSASIPVTSELTVWGGADTTVAGDSVRTMLADKADSLRTTLGSAPLFRYRQLYAKRAIVTDYTFKPGFGLVLIERYIVRPGGATVCVRRDQVTSYFLQPLR